MRIKNKCWIILLSILVVCILFTSIHIIRPYFTLKLNGQSEITLNLNDTYKEAGTNKDKAVISGSVDTSKEGKYTLTYSYGNQTLKRVVTVVDPSRVIFSYKGSPTTIVKVNDPYIESGCTVYDKVDGYISKNVTTTGTVDTSKVGDYTITYTVTNSAGYTLKKERTVKVVKEDQYQWATSFPVLMYHWVYSNDGAITNINNNFILDTTLGEQMKYLVDEGYYFASYEELAAFINGKISLPEKSVIVSFDDGAKSFLKYGIPVLNQYNIPATSFLIGIKDGKDKIKNYVSSNLTFQSHSYNMHRGGGNIGHGGVISALTQDEIIQDLQQSIELVGNNDAFAYPFGDVTEDGKQAVSKTGFKVAFTTENRRCVVGDDVLELPRVRINGGYTMEKFIEVLTE